MERKEAHYFVKDVTGDQFRCWGKAAVLEGFEKILLIINSSPLLTFE